MSEARISAEALRLIDEYGHAEYITGVQPVSELKEAFKEKEAARTALIAFIANLELPPRISNHRGE